MIKLKACPCCGSRWVELINYKPEVQVQCFGCFLNTGPHETDEEAAKTWNRRRKPK